jgi:hypothetical protein
VDSVGVCEISVFFLVWVMYLQRFSWPIKSCGTFASRKAGWNQQGAVVNMESTYYDLLAPTSYGGLSQFKPKGYTKKQVREWLQSQDTYTLHTPTRRRLSCLSMERPMDIGITRLYMSTSTWILCCKKTILSDALNPPSTGSQFHRLQRVSWEIVV